MMPPLLVPIDERRSFFAPQFEIRLAGQPVGGMVLRDVAEVSYTDDSENLDSFEFTLADWDPVERLPKYSSPWGPDGARRRAGGIELPNFEPGADVELYMGYLGDRALRLMLRGEVVSITPVFPAAGAPTCRVRALNRLYRLQRARVSGSFTGKPLEIAAAIARQAGVADVRLPAMVPGASGTDTLANAVAFEEIHRRARAAGLVPRLEEADGRTTLFFDPPVADTPVASLVWGLNLVSFAPQLSTRGAVEQVVVRSGDAGGAGAAQRVLGQARWADLDIDPAVLGPRGLDEVEAALAGSVEEINDAEVRSEADARERALARLREIASELVSGSGTTIGTPELRAGSVVEIAQLGPRFSGLYKLTATTHSIGAAGYTTGFTARKLVLRSAAA